MQTNPLDIRGQLGPQAGGKTDALRGVDLDDFLQLMITELQNQDPLNPLENDQILQQLSQIRSIEASQQLSTTLDAVLLGQSLSNASGLIDQQIRGLTDDGEEIVGRVERVSIEGKKPRVVVGESTVKLENIREILPPDGEIEPASE